MSLPETITFQIAPSNDPELTCVVCRLRGPSGVDREFYIKGDGLVTGIGVHSKCLNRLFERNPQTIERCTCMFGDDYKFPCPVHDTSEDP